MLYDASDIIKSGVARNKFLTSFFSDRDNCDKLKPCKYFILLHACLKIETTKIRKYGFEDS